MEEQSRLNEQRIARMNERQARERSANDPHKKLKDNLKLLSENVSLAIDMIAAVDPATENVRQNEIIPPLVDSLAKQRGKMGEMIGQVADEDLLLMLLTINDDINNVVKWYEELCQGIKPYIPSHVAVQHTGKNWACEKKKVLAHQSCH